MTYFAHSGLRDDKGDWEGLPDHLNRTAAWAAGFAAPFGLGRLASLTALLHDLGKYDPRFQERLSGKNLRVDHSTAGAVILRDLAKGRDGYTRIMAELAGYAILGHHAGLPDKYTDDPSCFVMRANGFQNRLDAVWNKEISPDLAGIVPDWMPRLATSPYLNFDLSVVVRFLFSCLVDADFKETEAFYAKLERREVDRGWMPLRDLLPEFRQRFDAYMARLPRDGDLNTLRRDILAHMRGKAGLPPGVFTLTVPTGGGKTLASLGFALDHAAINGHRRIIYSIPFTEAWIETRKPTRCRKSGSVASRTEAWIETRDMANHTDLQAVASRTEAWIETNGRYSSCKPQPGRLPHGGVDRNLSDAAWVAEAERVASRTEAWIETSPAPTASGRWASRLPHGGVDRNPSASPARR